MKILVPLANRNSIDRFIEAGADEFYMGFEDNEWNNEFGPLSDINRMSGFKRANKHNLDDVIDIAEEVSNKGKGLFVTINASHYDEKQIDRLDKYFERLSTSKISGVIVSCPELVVLAKKHGIKPVCSTIAASYNDDILKFYRNIGIEKVIFPRDITLKEIASMIRSNPGLEYEVFLMRNGCMFSDSNCLCMHREPYRSLCGMLRHSEKKVVVRHGDFMTDQNFRVNSFAYHKIFMEISCAMCAIYDFVKMGVTSGKVVGRADQEEGVIADVRVLKQNIEIAEKANSREEYLKNMIMPFHKDESCNLGYSCYYPEIRFGEEW